jgi:small subunit ribosomal protein S6
VFIARQDISTPQAEALADLFTKALDERGGRVARREYWGLRSLAFRLRKNRKGHYMLLNIEAPAEAVHEMERQMRINEDVIRHMTIRVDALSEGPSAMMQSRTSRGDERGRREDRGRGDRFRGGDERPQREHRDGPREESQPVEGGEQ